MADLELTVQHASRPLLQISDKYDIDYDWNMPLPSSGAPKPQLDASNVDLIQSPTLVVAVSGTISRTSLYTTWALSNPTLVVADYENPRSRWSLHDDTYGDLWYATYGLLPSSYSRTNYRLISVDSLIIYGDYQGSLIYTDTGGEYSAAGSAIDLAHAGNKAEIAYTVTLERKTSPYGEVTITGTSTSYSVNNSPYNTALALYAPVSGTIGQGDMKGNVTMTETPTN